jgi:predicted nucleotidyltransferase
VRVFRALGRDEVLAGLTGWAIELRRLHPEITRLGLFGSYARGDYAPGSDIDLLIIVAESHEPLGFKRSAAFDTNDLPIGADVFVYTEAELERLGSDSPWLAHILGEVVWVL